LEEVMVVLVACKLAGFADRGRSRAALASAPDRRRRQW
jgi:hypothetical protein